MIKIVRRVFTFYILQKLLLDWRLEFLTLLCSTRNGICSYKLQPIQN